MERWTKLVRHRIPKLLDEQGVSYKKRIASAEECKTALVKKLEEEVREFAEAGSPEELADILEVVDALLALSEYQTCMRCRRGRGKSEEGSQKNHRRNRYVERVTFGVGRARRCHHGQADAQAGLRRRLQIDGVG